MVEFVDVTTLLITEFLGRGSCMQRSSCCPLAYGSFFIATDAASGAMGRHFVKNHIGHIYHKKLLIKFILLNRNGFI